MSDAASAWRSRLERQYRPDQVQLLFIGEAPPASGRFFYAADSGLYRTLRDAFAQVDPSITNANFLDRFKASGSYLMDLCASPVDRLDAASRRAAREESERRLCRSIKTLRPNTIVVMLRAIRPNIERAISCADWNGRIVHLPYPGRWVCLRELFVAGLVPEVEALLARTRI